MNKKRDAVDFETSLQELEALVERMESGKLSLEQSLKDFERGVTLTRTCQKALAEAEQRVKVLLEREGQAELQPFTPQENKNDS
ncbi:MAG: exodeoxyribonuclease VII small subunit [Chromatiales bacterium]